MKLAFAMKKVKLFLSLLGILVAPALAFPGQAQAYTRCTYTTDLSSTIPTLVFENRPVKMTVGGVAFNTADRYSVHLVYGDMQKDAHIPTNVSQVGDKLEFSFGGAGPETKTAGKKQLKIWDSEEDETCRVDYEVQTASKGCTVKLEPREPGLMSKLKVTFSNLGNVAPIGGWSTKVTPRGGATVPHLPQQVSASEYYLTVENFRSPGTYTVTLVKGVQQVCSQRIRVNETEGDPSAVVITPDDRADIGVYKTSGPEMCLGDKGISTALGCIPVGDSNEFVGWFLKWALGIAGGVAFILMIMAGFQIMTAGGNPEKVQGGRELLNAAVSGLVLIIFSIFLLKLIGVDILSLPGF